MNLLDFDSNKKVKNFLNLMFRYNMIPSINKPTRVTKSLITAIGSLIHLFKMNFRQEL